MTIRRFASVMLAAAWAASALATAYAQEATETTEQQPSADATQLSDIEVTEDPLRALSTEPSASSFGFSKPLTRANLVDVMETMTNQNVGGARSVSFKAGDHRGARAEGMVQAAADGSFKLVRDFKPYPAEVFDAKLS